MPSFIKKSLFDWSQKLAVYLPKQWHRVAWLQYMLLPVVLLFYLVVQSRRLAYRYGLLKSHGLTVPVLVIGNITVGGVGKTPLVIALVQQLQAMGVQVGVISRGYGRRSEQTLLLNEASQATEVGDEPLLIYRKTACPVAVGADRLAAGRALLAAYPNCQLVMTDDGLQHYRLYRNVELAVVSAESGFGNRWLLPAGPLREPLSRLDKVDAIVCNGAQTIPASLLPWRHKVVLMQVVPGQYYQLLAPAKKTRGDAFKGKRIVACAGIGNPQRFFALLTQGGLTFETLAFADHHQFSAQDFAKLQADIIILTEKDAVKCAAFADARFWVLPIEAKLDQSLVDLVLQRLKLT